MEAFIRQLKSCWWLITANRVLRFYISTAYHDEHWIKLVNFVVKAFTPMWFEIKANHYFTSRTRHIFKAVSLMKQESGEVQKVVFPVLQRSAYFAQPEKILIAMLEDENANNRELARRRIKKSRSEKSSKKVRGFKTPELNFECKDCHNSISWQSTDVTEPLLRRSSLILS